MNTILHKFNTVIHNPKVVVEKILYLTSPLWSDELYLKVLYRYRVGCRLNLSNPRTFTEKMQWLKLYNQREEYTTMVDKFAVKKFVAQIIGQEYIIPTLHVWDNANDIQLNSLPNKFVLKTTHGGGSCGVFVCKDKNETDLKLIKKSMTKALKQDNYNAAREWPYKNVPKRIIAEEYLEHDGDLLDYKFFCFNGKAEYCQVITGRESNMCIDFFDRDWNHQDFHEPAEYPFSAITINRPASYEKMLLLADTLASDIPFVRVDLYNIEGKIYFGEITFFPTAGFGEFSPIEWDCKFGELLTLPNKKKS